MGFMGVIVVVNVSVNRQLQCGREEGGRQKAAVSFLVSGVQNNFVLSIRRAGLIYRHCHL